MTKDLQCVFRTGCQQPSVCTQAQCCQAEFAKFLRGEPYSPTPPQTDGLLKAATPGATLTGEPSICTEGSRPRELLSDRIVEVHEFGHPGAIPRALPASKERVEAATLHEEFEKVCPGAKGMCQLDGRYMGVYVQASFETFCQGWFAAERSAHETPQKASNQRLTDLLGYWSTWNAAKHEGIVERAGDRAAREIAQLAHAEIARLQQELRLSVSARDYANDMLDRARNAVETAVSTNTDSEPFGPEDQPIKPEAVSPEREE